MTNPSFIDTETTGYHGIVVLIQAAIGDEPPVLWCPWTNLVGDTFEFIDKYVLNPDGVVGFNWSFDQFHLQKLYNVLELFRDRYGNDVYPEDYIEEIAELEPEARTYGKCLRPYKVLDLMLHARKNKFQSLMNRKDIRIRSVPYVLAHELVQELNKRITLPDVYFARKSDPTKRWTIQEIINDLGEEIPDLVDLVLKFAPSTSLKALAIHTGVQQAETRSYFEDVSLDKKLMSDEPGWCPYATAPHFEKKIAFRPDTGQWFNRWPRWIHRHIEHWEYNPKARVYAADDVEDTRGLYHFFDKPELGDDDSELAAMVGSTRWRGFAMDLPHLRKQLILAQEDLKKYKFQWNSPPKCRAMLEEHLEGAALEIVTGSKREVLDVIAKMKVSTICEDCYGLGILKGKTCPHCTEGEVETDVPHAAAKNAILIIEARSADKKRGDLVKLLMSDRFHPDFKIIGAKSGRMSGTGGLNAQGINSSKAIRQGFTLADIGEELDGGDFESFEVSSMAAVYNDNILSAELQNGLKIHAVLAMYLFDKTYEEVMATGELEGDKNLYFRGKRSLFALAYGGDEGTLARRSGVSPDKAEEAFHAWSKKYPTMAKGRSKVVASYTCLVQEEGIGSRIFWRKPLDFVSSLGGFKRFFTLEYQFCKVLYEIAETPPSAWATLKGRVTRRDRQQTVVGALRTATFAAAFNICSQCVRAAINHRIQSTGAEITKSFQRKLWDLQPKGVHEWKIRTMQVHDELLVVRLPELESEVISIKDEFLREYRTRIPLLEIGWRRMKSWAETH